MNLEELLKNRDVMISDAVTYLGYKKGVVIANYWDREYQNSIPGSVLRLNTLRLKEGEPILSYIPSYEYANDRTQQLIKRLHKGLVAEINIDLSWNKK